MDKNDIRICAGIVLYNPEDVNRVYECVSKLSEQVEQIFIFDNCTREYEFDFKSYPVFYMTEKENKGIAVALNRIMEKAKEEKFSWVITMDQDSIIPNELLIGYKSAIQQYDNIGILCPQVIDKRRPYMKPQNEENICEVETCITSGSCTSIEAWECVGKFDEWLFIDLVDDEFCKRLRLNNYKILKLNAFVLDQQFGNVVPKERKKQEFWLKLSDITHISQFRHLTYTNKVSPLRVYYTNRNIIYLNRKYKNYKFNFYYVYNCRNRLQFLLWYSFTRWLISDSKIEIGKAILRGIVDGKKIVMSYKEEMVKKK